MKKLYTTKPGKYPEKKITSTKDRFCGSGWYVEKVEEKYFFDFVSGAHGGKQKRIEIKAKDYVKAKDGLIGFDELCTLYGVF